MLMNLNNPVIIFKVLQIDPDATDDELKKRFRAVSIKRKMRSCLS